MTRRLAIIGAGGHGQLIAQHATTHGAYELAGFFDDTLDPGSEAGFGRVLGPTTAICDEFDRGKFDELLVGVGYSRFDFRKEIFRSHRGRIPFGRFVHPSASVDRSTTIGEGTVILAGCVLDCEVELGENVFLHPGCVIAHDCQIGAHCFFAPAVKIAGLVKVGECSFLGVGTTISNRLELCPGTLTGAGAVVVDHTSEPGWYFGVPARFRKQSTDTWR